MNVTITLIMYWLVAIALVCGGLYALNRGFHLVLSGKGRSRDESSVEAFGIRATVGSLGSLVMVTAFLWGYAAVLALPNYEDAEVRIDRLAQELEARDRQLAGLHSQLSTTVSEVGLIESELVAAQEQGELSEEVVAKFHDHIDRAQLAAYYQTFESLPMHDFRSRIEDQREVMRSLEESLERNDVTQSRQQLDSLLEVTDSIINELQPVDK